MVANGIIDIFFYLWILIYSLLNKFYWKKKDRFEGVPKAYQMVWALVEEEESAADRVRPLFGEVKKIKRKENDLF